MNPVEEKKIILNMEQFLIMVLFNLFICEIKSYYFLIEAGFIQNH